jgi:hypothetical protein
LITSAVLVTAALSLPPIMDLARPQSPAAASLKTPLLYDILAPVSNILDTLTLLSPVQYWATFALCAVVFFAPGIFRDLRRPRGFGFWSTIFSCLRFLGGTVAVIGIMLVVRRPMASLSLQDPDLIAVDFHSHTSASHDGRPDFDAERNREWHQSAGFDAAYITDHRTFDGALDASERNPSLAGGGTTLLTGVELRDADEHPLLLGVDARRMKISSPDWREAAVEADGGTVPPILILTLPGNIVRVPVNEYTGAIRLAAIEGSDGSPRGVAQTGTDRKGILALADKLHLAVVVGSDNHGWGRAAPAWSVLRIPGWRDMTPGSLDIAIRRTILARVPGTTEIIARRTAASPSGKVEIALGGAAVALSMLRTMNLRERFSWILWSWAGGLLSLIRARRNRRQLRIRVRENMRKRGGRPLIDAAAAVRAAS